jgi:hypothetical protein
LGDPNSIVSDAAESRAAIDVFILVGLSVEFCRPEFLSRAFHVFDLYPLNKNPLRSACGMLCIFCNGLRATRSPAATGALTNFRTFTGKATLPEPWDVAPHVCYSFKPKSLNCLRANVRDGFFNRIRRCAICSAVLAGRTALY